MTDCLLVQFILGCISDLAQSDVGDASWTSSSFSFASSSPSSAATHQGDPGSDQLEGFNPKSMMQRIVVLVLDHSITRTSGDRMVIREDSEKWERKTAFTTSVASTLLPFAQNYHRHLGVLLQQGENYLPGGFLSIISLQIIIKWRNIFSSSKDQNWRIIAQLFSAHQEDLSFPQLHLSILGETKLDSTSVHN